MQLNKTTWTKEFTFWRYLSPVRNHRLQNTQSKEQFYIKLGRSTNFSHFFRRWHCAFTEVFTYNDYGAWCHHYRTLCQFIVLHLLYSCFFFPPVHVCLCLTFLYTVCCRVLFCGMTVCFLFDVCVFIVWIQKKMQPNTDQCFCKCVVFMYCTAPQKYVQKHCVVMIKANTISQKWKDSILTRWILFSFSFFFYHIFALNVWSATQAEVSKTNTDKDRFHQINVNRDKPLTKK